MNQVPKRIPADIALRVSSLYALFGGLWILLSDRLLALLISDVSQLSMIQTYKGWAFVVISALLIYSLLTRELRRRGQAEADAVSLAKFPAENPNPILRISTDGIVLYANRNSQPLLDLWMCDVGSRLPDDIQDIVSSAVQNESPTEVDIDCNGRIFSMAFTPIEESGYVNVYGRDITARLRAEKKVIQMKRLYATLSQVNQMIVRVKERNELFQTICDVAVRFGEISVAWVGLLDEASGDVIQVAAQGLDLNHWPFPTVNIQGGLISNGLIARAIHASSVTTSADLQADQNLKPLHDVLREFGFHSSAVIPFRLRGHIHGALILISQEIGVFHDADEIRLLNEMGLDISFALDNIENEKERREAEASLQRSEERFRLLFENNHSVMLMIDPDSGSIRDANTAAAKFYGYSVAELRSMKIDQINQLTPEEVHAERMRALKEERNYFHFRHRLRSGEVRLVEVYSAPIEMEGTVVLFSIVHDITERKIAEDQLRQSEERYRLISENTADVIWVLDPIAGRFSYVSPSVEKLRGYTPAEVMAQPVSESLTAESFQFVSQSIAEGLPEFLSVGQGTRSFVSEVDQPCKDGSIVHTEVTTTFMFNSRGQVEVVGVSRDIHERRQAEEKLRRNEHLLRLFVEHSPASIAMFDRDMHYIIASQRYLTDYRLEQQDLTGRSHYDVFPEMPERWKDIHNRCLQGAIEKADEDPFPRADGTLDWVQWEIRPWYEHTGNIGGIILFSEVITERKKVKDELQLLNQQLEQRVLERTLELSQANRAKTEFLANMSHELRTPLNTVLGLSETLLEQRRGPLNEKQVQSIDLIASSGRHLLGLINDILEVSKIEAGKLQLYPMKVYVRELCESSLNFVREMAIRKRISIEFHDDGSMPAFHADPQRVKQILINLLTNAVKFTPERGRVSLDVHTNAEKDRILFTVSDTGIGIAQEDLQQLFTPFTQLDSSLARQHAGTGLGLALVHKLTDLHGGSVEVASEPGSGSRFTVALPVNQNMPDRIPDAAQTGSSDLRPGTTHRSMPSKTGANILLAEDNEVNSKVLTEYLVSHGYNVISAQNGEEVLEKAARNVPDMILMDIQMPRMDGLEAIRRLRADSRFISTPIIALTALAMPGDKERCLEAGANEYMSKPVNLQELRRSIQRLMSTSE